MVFEFQRQPLKFAYVAYEAIITLIFRLPFWLVRYSFRSLRPRPSWTFARSVFNAVLRKYAFVGTYAERIGLPAGPTHHAITPGPGVKGVWVKPVPDVIQGKLKEWSEASNVSPECIPGYWQDREGLDTPSAEKPSVGEKVLYFIHGGVFVALTAHPTGDPSAMARGILGKCPAAKRLFSIEYRLTTIHPEVRNPFPAALIDCLMGYRYLVNEVGFSPENVIIMGDSAGGNLAITLTRYLIDTRAAHPHLPHIPGGLLLISPWVDVGTSHEIPGSSLLTTGASDFISDPRKGLFIHARKAYCGPLGFAAANSNPYISPGSIHADMPDISFKDFPRTLILAGTGERFLDQIRSLKEKMIRDMGEGAGDGQVSYHEELDAVHVFLAFFWEEPSRSGGFERVAAWFSNAS